MAKTSFNNTKAQIFASSMMIQRRAKASQTSMIF